MASRQVWVLSDDRPGNRTQALAVARRLAWPMQEMRLAFNAWSGIAAPLLGATLASLTADARAAIAPPWPDLVIAAGRRSIPVARWIRKASGGKSRIVLIGRKTASRFADLTIRCAYYRQAPSADVLTIALPPTLVDATLLAEAGSARPDVLAGRTLPCCLVLVGGPTKRHAFSAAAAERMMTAIGAAADEIGASVAVVTSRRTPAEALAAIRRAAPDALIHEWSATQGGNLYLAFLSRADLIVVTGESESMLSDAVRAAHPLTIYPLAPTPVGPLTRLSDAIASRAEHGGRFARWLMATGFVTPRRDLADLHRLIVERKWGRVFDGSINTASPAPLEDEADIARRILGLFEPGAPRSGA